MRDLKRIDKFLLFLMIVFCIFGLIMIFSASTASTVLRYEVATSHFFKKQLEALIVAFIGGFIVLLIPTNKYKGLTYIGTLLIILALFAVLVMGKITGGARSWFKLGPLSLQPSEFAKVALVVFLAQTYDLLNKMNRPKPIVFLFPLVVPILMFILIMIEPDMGSALIIFLITIFTFFSVPKVRKDLGRIFKILIVPIILFVFLFFFAGDKILSNEQISRLNFKNPCVRYTDDTGYQVCNSLIAISNGGLFGVGLSNSTQKFLYLPESHTDFIFPIICEELGSIVGSIVIILYFVFLLRIYKIAKEADNLRTSILAYGAFWYFCSHIVINLLGILALVPLTGVPLPFLSYGGSYALCCIIMCFIVERVAIENNKNRLTREMSKIIN